MTLYQKLILTFVAIGVTLGAVSTFYMYKGAQRSSYYTGKQRDRWLSSLSKEKQLQILAVERASRRKAMKIRNEAPLSFNNPMGELALAKDFAAVRPKLAKIDKVRLELIQTSFSCLKKIEAIVGKERFGEFNAYSLRCPRAPSYNY